MKNIYIILLFLFFVTHSLVAQTFVGPGTINGATWTKAGQPYIITGDIIIEDLTILPGVSVLFDSAYHFEVDGTLLANGFYSDSILFQPDPANTNGWGGISFNSGSSSSSLSYCRISGSHDHGILIDQSAPSISNCNIVYNDSIGVYVRNTTTLSIVNCFINFNNSIGVVKDTGQVSIKNSIIANNFDGGILVTTDQGILEIINCVIADNQGTGVDCQIANNEISNSIIYDNTTELLYGSSLVLNNNIGEVSPLIGLFGNINVQPDFVDHMNYKLSDTSECIDKGRQSISFYDTYFPPSLGTITNDMGAYGGPGAGNWFPPLYVIPQNYDFGQVENDSSKSFILKIKNYRNTAIFVSDVFFEGDATVFSSNLSTINVTTTDTSYLAVTFLPTQQGLYTADLVLRTVTHGDIRVPLRGECIAPQLHVYQTSIDYGKVLVSSDSIHNLYLHNLGQVDLIIDHDSLNIEGSSTGPFSIYNGGSDLTIAPGDSAALAISFLPDQLGLILDTLWIYSNDPASPWQKVSLQGEGVVSGIILSNYNIDFGRIPVKEDSASQLYIYNLGTADIIINHDSLEITGATADEFSFGNVNQDIVIAAGDSSDFTITFQPDQIGVKQANLRIFSNDMDHPWSNVTLIGIGYDDKDATIVVDLNQTFTSGQNGNVSFNISSHTNIDSVLLYARQGGKTTFTKFLLQDQSGDVWSGSIVSELITERGLEYYVEAFHGWTSTLSPETGSNIPHSLKVAVASIDYPNLTKAEKYQMISIPLSTSGQNLDDLFGDELGQYDNTKYRFYEVSGGSNYSEITSLDKELTPGKSVWLITKEQKRLSIENAESVRTDQDFEIRLSPGWNMIATPFSFTIDWSSNTNLALRFYDGTEWGDASWILEPYKGYAVHSDNTVRIFVSPREIQLGKQIAKDVFASSDEGWRIQISAEADHFKDQFNYVGAFESATSGIDLYDYREPPPIGNYISVYLLPENHDGYYSTDYRKPGAEGYTFSFEMKSNVSGQKEIQFFDENLPSNFDFVIASPETKTYYSQQSIQTSIQQTRYKLIIGTEEYIDNALADYKTLPQNFNLSQNFPNPFNPKTSIKYQLPNPTRVSINVFNILGQHINTLVNNSKKEAGYYQIEWDGTNFSGNKVSSGIYFLQIKTENFSRSIKMILQK